MWVSYYEPTLGTWSKPRQLTHDDSAERFVSGAFDANENLLCIYDKTHTEYEDKTVDVNSQQVVVKDVPKAGQSDLFYLRYSLAIDLAIAVEDVNTLPINPEPNSTATISAIVHNIGESAANDVNVAFYAGNPQSGGTLIGEVQTLPGPLASGYDANVSVTWHVPETNSPINIYVVVDPYLVQDDRNTTNNTAIVKMLVPDLSVNEIIAQKAGRDQIVTVRVANEGVIEAENFEMELRRDDPNGLKLGGAHIFEILPGAYQDVTFTLSSLPVGNVNVFAIIDVNNLVDELGEENNYHFVRISNYASGDFEPDGDVDWNDLYTLTSEWLSTGANLKADIYPLGGDGIVDFFDFAEFAKDWLSQFVP
jgi:hypothetical protein